MIDLLLWFGVSMALVVGGYFLAGVLAFLTYDPPRADHRAEDVAFAITTIGSVGVADSLFDAIAHHHENYREYPLHVIVDEGAAMADRLREDDRVQLTVVPDAFEATARAKGRAQHYFATEVVPTYDPETWFVFLDDDNKLLSDELLYEIPVHDAAGYRAANPVLYPRPGDSALSFVLDHIRTVEDLTAFRFFTGTLRTPMMGFHGELLTVRGDVLDEIGFDHHASLVEDYVFASRLVAERYDTWQTNSWVSILSPHSLGDLFRQRRRWYLGLLAEQRRTPLAMVGVMSVRLVPWTFGLLGGATLLPLWAGGWAGLFPVIETPLAVTIVVTSLAIAHLGALAWGVHRLPLPAWRYLHVPLVPVYAAIELLTVPYSLLTARRVGGFEVIDK